MFSRRLVPLLEFGREREGIDLSKVQLTHHSLKGQGKQPLRLGEVRRPATRVFLYIWRGKLREAGLGAASKGGVSLKAARDKAAEGRTLIKAGVDPISELNRPCRPLARRRTLFRRGGPTNGATKSTRRNGP